MKICIIGAGKAGLCSAKNALDNNFDITIFEQQNDVGGIWVYNDKIGLDKFDNEVHGSIYKGLRTNLPKEIMGFPDFPYPDSDKSYITAEEVLQFLKSYADKYNLKKFIKFQNNVIRVKPLFEKNYEVIVHDMLTGQYNTYYFDYIMVCNGHYSFPNMPNIQGMNLFKGKQLHSHDYRDPELFKNESVLIVGYGSSALDIAVQVSDYAKYISISHHSKIKANLPKNIIEKPDIFEIYDNEVKFMDGTIKKYSVIIYCTGYQYRFPFLSSDCNLNVDENYVKPLWKHIFNIEYPSIAFIGLLNNAQLGHLMDLQVKFALSYFSRINEFPTKMEMYQNMKDEMQERSNIGFHKNKSHYLGLEFQKKYYDDLANTAKIINVPPVMLKLYKAASCTEFMYDLLNFRENRFRIIDEENFIKL